jgi:hypothetical protein
MGQTLTQKIRSIFTFTLITLCGFALASCGGGSGNKSTGNPANTEVINGIPVPPEPDPVQNNATVAGVDVNSNGVRDDVERKIAIDYSNKYNQVIAVAKLQEKSINATNDVDFSSNYIKTECEKVKLFSNDQFNEVFLNEAFLNTDERRIKYIENIGKYNSVARNGGETNCD